MHESILAGQITASAVLIWLMQLGKRVPWLPITHDTTKLNRIVAMVGSGLVAIGVHSTYSWNPLTRELAFAAHIPTFTVLLLGSMHWIRSYVFTEVMYQGYKAKQTVNEPPAAAPPAQSPLPGVAQPGKP